MRYRWLIVFILGGIACQVWGDARAVDRYLQSKREYRVESWLGWAQVQNDPVSYQGRVIELRGTISGVAKVGETVTFILNLKTGEQAILRTTESPILPQNGESIRVLGQVPEDTRGGITALRWLAWISEYDMVERESLWAKQQERAALRRRQAEMQSTRTKGFTRSFYPSRGVYSPLDPAVVNVYRRAILYFNPCLNPSQADLITQSILAYSMYYNVDARLIVAMIAVESGFRPEATSRKGAMGLGQLMPGTARGLGISNAYDPRQNIAGAVRLVRGHLESFIGKHLWQGDPYDPDVIALALASYNAGSGAVRRYGGVPPYRETRNHVVKVWNLYRRLCGG